MHAHPVGFARPPPGAAAILERADQFLLLGVDRDRRLPMPLRSLDGLGNVAELRIPIRMLPAFAGLDVALQRVTQPVQQIGDDGMADGVAECLQRDRQRPDTLATPPQRRVGVAGRRRLHQRIEVAQQIGIERGGGFPATAWPAVRLGGNEWCASSSRKPRWIVGREIPVARSTKPMPPCPSARASVAAHIRRERSVNTGASAACFARKTHRYTATSYGLKVAFFYAKLYLRILRPNWAALLPDADSLPRSLRAALDQLDTEIQKLHEEAVFAA
jgi:hypothetical protein